MVILKNVGITHQYFPISQAFGIDLPADSLYRIERTKSDF